MLSVRWQRVLAASLVLGGERSSPGVCAPSWGVLGSELCCTSGVGVGCAE